MSKKSARRHVIAQVARQISSNSTLSKIASIAVKEEVDHIYGYKKYPLYEIASELEERLYNPTYLGCAVSAILERPEPREAEKTHLAENYLDVVVSYLRGDMPKKTDEYWGDDAEPSCVVEAAAYLAERKKLDWTGKKQYLEAVLSFTKDSSVQAKKSLLQALVRKINEEGRQRQTRPQSKEEEGLTNLLSSEDLVADSLLGLFKAMGSQRPKEDQRKSQLIANLSALVDAEGEESSAGALCRLSFLDKDDLVQIFVDLPLLTFLRRTPSNRTLLYYDVAQVLCRERNVPFASIVQAMAMKLQDEGKKSKRVIYYADEPKLKALSKLAVEIGESRNAELLGLMHSVLKLKGVETETRLVLFKFLYENSEKRKELLDEASRFKSGRIRAWAASEEMTIKQSRAISSS